MYCSRLCSIRCGRRGGHCYYEQGRPFLSHASSRCPAGRRPIVSHTHGRVGSRIESFPPDTWTESGQTPALTESSSSRECSCLIHESAVHTGSALTSARG